MENLFFHCPEARVDSQVLRDIESYYGIPRTTSKAVELTGFLPRVAVPVEGGVVMPAALSRLHGILCCWIQHDDPPMTVHLCEVSNWTVRVHVGSGNVTIRET